MNEVILFSCRILGAPFTSIASPWLLTPRGASQACREPAAGGSGLGWHTSNRGSPMGTVIEHGDRGANVRIHGSESWRLREHSANTHDGSSQTSGEVI